MSGLGLGDDFLGVQGPALRVFLLGAHNEQNAQKPCLSEQRNGDEQQTLAKNAQGRFPPVLVERQSSFPSSAWERTGAKLCFASGSSPHLQEAELPRRAFPSRAWERG